MNLDIAFSDHYVTEVTLTGFGDVIRALRQVCDNDHLRFWSFLHYVSTRYPEVLRVELSQEQRDSCEEVLLRANPPPVVYEEAPRARMMRELLQRPEPPKDLA